MDPFPICICGSFSASNRHFFIFKASKKSIYLTVLQKEHVASVLYLSLVILNFGLALTMKLYVKRLLILWSKELVFMCLFLWSLLHTIWKYFSSTENSIYLSCELYTVEYEQYLQESDKYTLSHIPQIKHHPLTSNHFGFYLPVPCYIIFLIPCYMKNPYMANAICAYCFTVCSFCRSLWLIQQVRFEL
jgi:hypothetical protein